MQMVPWPQRQSVSTRFGLEGRVIYGGAVRFARVCCDACPHFVYIPDSIFVVTLVIYLTIDSQKQELYMAGEALI